MTAPKTRIALVGALVLTAASPALAAPTPAAWTPPTPMTAGGKYISRDGKEIFHTVCANCHMQDAKGAEGAGVYPALASNPKLGSAAYPIMVVVHGQKGMPGFGANLDDEQVAAVVAYIRTSFGNRYRDPVKAEEVKAMR
jgi:mono/diheme cytochrome c family protein